MREAKRSNKESDPPLRFRPLDAAADLHLIAETVTGGNISEAIRLSIREKAERLRLEPAA